MDLRGVAGGDGELGCLCGKAGTSHLCDGSAPGCVVNGVIIIITNNMFWFIMLLPPLQGSRYASRGNMEGAHKAVRRSERCTVVSYRIGVVTLITLTGLLLAGAILVFCFAVDETHTGDSF